MCNYSIGWWVALGGILLVLHRDSIGYSVGEMLLGVGLSISSFSQMNDVYIMVNYTARCYKPLHDSN